MKKSIEQTSKPDLEAVDPKNQDIATQIQTQQKLLSTYRERGSPAIFEATDSAAEAESDNGETATGAITNAILRQVCHVSCNYRRQFRWHRRQ